MFGLDGIDDGQGYVVVLAKVKSIVLVGIEAIECEIEVNVSKRGFAGINIVGLPDTAVKESIDRIKTALVNCGYQFPRHRILVNLAPADIRKEGVVYDLPIAIGILLADGQIECPYIKDYVLLGELALDGRLRAVKGGLSAGMLAKREGYKGVVVPRGNVNEVAVVDEIEAIGVSNLSEVVGFLSGKLPLEPVYIDVEGLLEAGNEIELDFADVKGQEHAKRAMMISAAGGHNVLMIGPPGSGKTMLAQRLPGILPPLTLEEALEVTQIYSSVGLLDGKGLITRRPVRMPHHSASAVALVGGGNVPRAGEISLAHYGVLFLDEMPEFNRSTLEMIRQPMEDGRVVIARAKETVEFPASFILVGAMNPCPCGYYGHPKKRCKCTPNQIERYIGKISGPLLDRIDIHIEVPPVDLIKLSKTSGGLSSAQMRKQVIKAREVQKERFKDRVGMCNGKMSVRDIKKYCKLDEESETILKHALSELALSARAYNKVLKIARTIADLEESYKIEPIHISEAIQYRRLDRAY